MRSLLLMAFAVVLIGAGLYLSLGQPRLLFQPAPHLNGKHTVFGKLVAGWDVLDAIEKAPTSAVIFFKMKIDEK